MYGAQHFLQVRTGQQGHQKTKRPETYENIVIVKKKARVKWINKEKTEEVLLERLEETVYGEALLRDTLQNTF